MAKKRYLEGDFFEGYSLLGIICGLPDFRATHFINQYGSFEFKKHEPFSLSPASDTSFSWYYFNNEELRRDYYLIQNKNGTETLMQALHNFDYLLLMYGNITAQYIGELLPALRKMPYVTAVFEQDLNTLKNGDLLIEKNELHALKQGIQ
jgi:hypothetical protein